MTKDAMIEFRDVHKYYGDYHALRGITATIRPGEFFSLLGPSGCGKTTLLRTIAGFEDISSGAVLVDGRDMAGVPANKRPTNMVFQSYAIFPHLSVEENVGFGLRRDPRSKEEKARAVGEALEMVGLKGYGKRAAHALSGGQRQRVALARSIVREPAAFLMDEPLSNLDAKLRVSTRAQIKNLHHTLKTTTIYVTHDQIEAMTLADRVVVMNKGLIQQVGTPTEIYDRPANTFVAGFIGSPAMNLVQGEVQDGTFTGDGIRITGITAPVRGPVTLGFRAEDATLVGDGGEIAAPIYSLELLGEASMVSMRVGGELVSIKAAKDFRAEIGDGVRAHVPVQACHFFDRTTGQRIGG